MTKTTRKNLTVKALQTELAYLEKSPLNAYCKDTLRMERKLIGAVNNRGENLDYDAVMQYCKTQLQILGVGATKIAYGTDHLAICFIDANHEPRFGNQIALQVKAWERIALSNEARFFNPVLSYGLHRGDKLHPMDKRYLNKSFIVSPKAQFYGGIRESIIATFKLNNQPYNKEGVDAYYTTLMKAADIHNIGDLHGNNVGVIFDFSINQYKTVITDYGLNKF